jgi:DedD protein
MEENDVQLQLKKRARRRVVGAVAFVSVVAVVLPMVMDHEPRQVVHDVEIRIPGQDEKPFAPKFAVAPVEKPAEVAST